MLDAALINHKLFIFLALMVLLFFILVLSLIRRDVIEIKYAFLWIITGCVLSFILLSPRLLVNISNNIGFGLPIHLILFGGIVLLVIVNMGFTVALTRYSKRITTMAQIMGIMGKEIEDLKALLQERFVDRD